LPSPPVCEARKVHVTEPPDAVGVTDVRLVAFSIEHNTTMRSPAVTANAVVVFGVVVLEKLPVDGML
jgi:hypothetical protein